MNRSEDHELVLAGKRFAATNSPLSCLSFWRNYALFIEFMKLETVSRGVCSYVLLCACFHVPQVFASVPVNDMFADRIPVTGLPLRLVGDTTEATVEPEEPTEIQPGWGRRLERSVWWSWTATESRIVG